MWGGGYAAYLYLAGALLDVGHDDYYAHNQPWFDVQDSPFLVHVGAPRYTLSVESTGGGVIAADLPGLYCHATCTATFDSGTQVRLYGNADTGKALSAWSGACTGTAACRVTMSGDRSVKATFVTGTAPTGGSGGSSRNQKPVSQIASPGRYTFEAHQTVTLTSKAYDRDGRIVTQAWDWGDGTRAEGPSSSHAYAKDGRYSVSLTVTDDKQATAVRRVTINVHTQPPRVMALFALAQRGRPIDLRYIAFDNTGLARVRVTVTRGKKRLLLRTVRFAGTRSTSSSVRWKARGGDAMFCVKAWDVVGNASSRDCTTVRVH